MNRLILSLTLLLACCSSAWAQNRTDSSEVMKQLLAAPAPPPRTAETALAEQRDREKFYDKDNVPRDDAPIDDLLAYWRRWAGVSNGPEPSNTVRHRLLDASIDDGEQLRILLPFFPAAEEFAEKIKRGYDRIDDNPKTKWQRDEIKKWLLFNSKYFLAELTALAGKVEDNETRGYIENKSALLSLATVDWSTAEPLLQNLHQNGAQRTATLALSLLYEHSVKEKDDNAAEKFRAQLQSIASDRNFPGSARDIAIETLSTTSWSGRDDWYLSLFKDESLLLLRDVNYVATPLTYLFDREPDKWIPVMSKLAAGKDRTVRQNAASCLVSYSIHKPARDTILPVLPWLSDPEWLPLGTLDRIKFIETLADVEIPEGIPGLIWIVENDPYDARSAAKALARYKDPRAIPALKQALAEALEDNRPLLIEGLVASGGLSELEQVNALEAYAAMLTTDTGREELRKYRSHLDEPLPMPVSIGSYLAQQKNVPDSLVRAVLTRAKSLRAKNEDISKALLEIAHEWQGRQVALDLVRRIAENIADAPAIFTALRRRENLAETVPAELHALLSAGGTPQGISAILLNNPDLAHSVLTSGNAQAQTALLACARLTRTPLPIDLVGRLLQSKNALLSKAAESYLLAEDSKEAQSLLWRHYPNKAFVTGWRDYNVFMDGDGLVQIGKAEEKLRSELFKEGGPIEIFALLTTSEAHSRVVRVYSDKIVYTNYEDASRYRERIVPRPEFAVFKEYVTANRLRELGPQFGACHHNCWTSQFLALSKEAGRRVFSHQGFQRWAPLIDNFDRLGKGEGARIQYHFEKEIKGLEVLFANESLAVKDVWQQGDEIRIFVEQNDTKEWRKLKANDASSVATAPDGYQTYDESAFPLDDVDNSEQRQASDVQVLSSDTILIARNSKGLWKQVAGTKPVRISGDTGAYGRPIVTPNGKWAVIAKTDSHWSGPNYLVRFDLETGREFRVNVEPEEQLDALVFLPVHEKVLVRRAKDEFDVSGQRINQNIPPQYYLLDPKTGEVQSIAGEFTPLREEGNRFLQPTGQPGEYWAAIPDEKQTRVGRYNLKDFSFKPVLTVPQISFESRSMWVDEKEGKLYVVYRDQLLRLPLKSSP